MCSTRLALKGGAPKRLMIDATHLKAHVRDINFELSALFCDALDPDQFDVNEKTRKTPGRSNLAGVRGLRAKEVALKDP